MLFKGLLMKAGRMLVRKNGKSTLFLLLLLICALLNTGLGDETTFKNVKLPDARVTR